MERLSYLMHMFFAVMFLVSWFMWMADMLEYDRALIAMVAIIGLFVMEDKL